MPAATQSTALLDDSEFEGRQLAERLSRQAALKRNAGRLAQTGYQLTSSDLNAAFIAPLPIIGNINIAGTEFKPVQLNNLLNTTSSEALRAPASDNDNEPAALHILASNLYTDLANGYNRENTVAVQPVYQPLVVDEVKRILALTDTELRISVRIQMDDASPYAIFRDIDAQVRAGMPPGGEHCPNLIYNITLQCFKFFQQTQRKTASIILTSDEIQQEMLAEASEAQLTQYFANRIAAGKVQLTNDHKLGNGTAAGSGTSMAALLANSGEGEPCLSLLITSEGSASDKAPSHFAQLAAMRLTAPIQDFAGAAMTEAADEPARKKIEQIAERITAIELLAEGLNSSDADPRHAKKMLPEMEKLAKILANPETMQDLTLGFGIIANQKLAALGASDNPLIRNNAAIKQITTAAETRSQLLVDMAPPTLRLQAAGLATAATPAALAVALASPMGQATLTGLSARAQNALKAPASAYAQQIIHEAPLDYISAMQAALIAAPHHGNPQQLQQLAAMQQIVQAVQPINQPLAVEASASLDLTGYQALMPQLADIQQILQQQPQLLEQWPSESPAAQTLLQLRDNPLPQTPHEQREAILNIIMTEAALTQISPAALINQTTTPPQQVLKKSLQAVFQPAKKIIAADALRENILPLQAAVNAAVAIAPDNQVLQMVAVKLRNAVAQHSEITSLQLALQPEIKALKPLAKNPAFKELADFAETVERFDRKLAQPIETGVQHYLVQEPARIHFKNVTGLPITDFINQAHTALRGSNNPQRHTQLDGLLGFAATPAMGIAALGMAIAAAGPTNFVQEARRFNIVEQLNQWRSDFAHSGLAQQAAQVFRAHVLRAAEPQALLETLAPAMHTLLAQEPAAALAQLVTRTREASPTQLAENYITAVAEEPQRVAAMRNEANSPAQPAPHADPLVVRDAIHQNIRQIEQALAADPDNPALQAVHKALASSHMAIDAGERKPGTAQVDAKALAAIEAHLQTLQTLLLVSATNADDPALQAVKQTLLQQIANDIAKAAGVEIKQADPASLITKQDPLAVNTTAAPATEQVAISVSAATSPSDILGMLALKLSPEQRTFLLAEWALRNAQANGHMTVGMIVYREISVSESLQLGDLLAVAYDPTVAPHRQIYALYLFQQKMGETQRLLQEQQRFLMQQAIDQQTAKAQADLAQQQLLLTQLQTEQQRLATVETQRRQAVSMVVNNLILANQINIEPIISPSNTDNLRGVVGKTHQDIQAENDREKSISKFVGDLDISKDGINKRDIPEKIIEPIVTIKDEEWVITILTCPKTKKSISIRHRKGETINPTSYCPGGGGEVAASGDNPLDHSKNVGPGPTTEGEKDSNYIFPVARNLGGKPRPPFCPPSCKGDQCGPGGCTAGIGREMTESLTADLQSRIEGAQNSSQDDKPQGRTGRSRPGLTNSQ